MSLNSHSPPKRSACGPHQVPVLRSLALSYSKVMLPSVTSNGETRPWQLTAFIPKYSWASEAFNSPLKVSENHMYLFNEEILRYETLASDLYR